MPIWTIQLEAMQPFERSSLPGFIVCVEIDAGAANEVVARYWRTDFFGIDWMENAQRPEVRTGPATDLSPLQATRILNPLRSAQLCVASPGSLGYLHPTMFKLMIRSGLTESHLAWAAQLPDEWRAIEEAVQVLRALGEGRANDA
jgi:hypothetical protein